MRKIELYRKDELERWFVSSMSARKIAIEMGITSIALHDAWIRIYGKEAVTSRGKRLRFLNGRKTLNHKKVKIDCESLKRILEAFFEDVTITTIASTEDLDERTIRRIWREKFGNEKVKTRSIHMSSKALESSRCRIENKTDIIDRLYNIQNIRKVAKELGVSVSFIRKIISKDHNLINIIKNKSRHDRKEKMHLLRMCDAITKEDEDKVIKLVDSDMSIKEIAKHVGLCASSVCNIFKQRLSVKEHANRTRRMNEIGKIRGMQALVKSGKIGSKPENEFCRLLHFMLVTEVKHHDLDILLPFEIDITLPKLKIAIMWDGIGHIKPIFGEKIFRQVKYRDKWKRKELAKMGWTVFEVIDTNSRFRASFIEQQVLKLFRLLEEMGYANAIRQF